MSDIKILVLSDPVVGTSACDDLYGLTLFKSTHNFIPSSIKRLQLRSIQYDAGRMNSVWKEPFKVFKQCIIAPELVWNFLHQQRISLLRMNMRIASGQEVHATFHVVFKLLSNEEDEIKCLWQ
jgi:hypothetical protein